MSDLFDEIPAKPKDLFDELGIAPSITEQNLNAATSGASLSSPQTEDESWLAGIVGDNTNQLKVLAQSRFSPEQIASFENNPIGIWESWKFLKKQDVVPGGGLVTAYDTARISMIADKKSKGEQLSDHENKLMGDFLDRQIEEGLRGYTVLGGIGYGLPQVPAFGIEFIASGGVGKAAQTAATKVVSKVAKGAAIKSAVGVTANVAARAAVMPQMYLPKIAERRLNDFTAVTDKGELVLKESEESPAKSAMMAYSYTLAEVASEMSGAAIGKYVINPVSKAVKTPLISAVNNLPSGVKTGIYEAYKKIQPNAKISEVFTQAGWNGMLEELGEEQVNRVLQGAIGVAGDGYTGEDFLNAITPTPEQLMTEAGIIAIAQGARTSASVAANIMKTQGVPDIDAQFAVDNMSALEQDNFVIENIRTPRAPFIMPSGDTAIAAAQSAMRQSRDDYEDGLPQQTSAEQDLIASQMASVEKSKPRPVDVAETFSDKYYRLFVNEYQPLVNLELAAKQRGYDIKDSNSLLLLTREYAYLNGLTSQNLQVQTSYRDENGQYVNTGKALMPIIDDYNNYFMQKEPSVDVRESDFNDYLVARRYLSDLQNMEDVTVTEQQKQESLATMARLQEKYGEDMQMMSSLAQEVYDYQKRILENLVRSGVLSKEKFDAMTATHKNYVPFQRELDEEVLFMGISGKGQFTDAKASKVIKTIKGSEKEVKNPIFSIMKNTARILDLAARNNVAVTIANFSDTMPEYVKKVEKIAIKRGTTDVKVTYDAGLRRKLESAISYFGNNLSREKSIKGKGFVRGNYSAMEKMVRVRLGTNEGTLAHEVGHMLDFELGLMELMLSDNKVKKELQELGRKRMSGNSTLKDLGEKVVFEDITFDVNNSNYEEYIISDREIIANMFDAYVNAPSLLKDIAPNALFSFEKIIDKNPKLQFIKDIKPTVERAEEVIQREVWSPLDFAPQGTIAVFRDGKAEYYEVAPAMLEAVRSMSPIQLGFVEKFFMGATSIFRAGATLVPEFWLRNFVRDQHVATMQSGINYNLRDFARGFAGVLEKGDLFNRWEQSQGRLGSLYMDMSDKGIEKAYKEMMRPDGKLMLYAKNPFRILEDASMTIEQATRLGLFSKAELKGYSQMQAAQVSRDTTTDFMRRGKIGKYVNRYVPFFNASLQGVDKMMRFARENPKLALMYGLGTITFPSMMITGYYLYGAPEEKRKEFLEIPQWQKDIFWVFEIDGNWTRVPKPFSWGYAFGSIPERMMTYGFETNDQSVQEMWGEMVLGLAGSLSPIQDATSVIPPMLKGAIEATVNYNFFMDRPIYPKFLDEREPWQRFTNNTSETAKLIGKEFNVSPAIIENSARSVIASSSQYLFGAGDAILEQVQKWNGEDVAEKPITAADVPVIRAFAVRAPEGYRSVSASKFFNRFEEIKQKRNTLNNMEGEDATKYQEENQQLISLYKPMEKYRRRMNDINKKIKEIEKQVGVSGDDKLEQIQQMEREITVLAREANQLYDEASNENR